MESLVQATIVRSRTLRKHFIGYSNNAYEQSVQMATAEHERAACIAESFVDKKTLVDNVFQRSLSKVLFLDASPNVS